MATRKFTTTPAVRTVYTSPCGRVTVERHGPREYLALLDNQPCGFHDYAFQAEHAGHAALSDALLRERVIELDEAAERDEERVIDLMTVSGMSRERAAEILATPELCNELLVVMERQVEADRLADELTRRLPVVTAEIDICDDQIDSRVGQRLGVEYKAGDVLASDGDDFPVIEVYPFGGDAVTIDELEAAMPAFLAILADPRIKAARQRKARALVEA